MAAASRIFIKISCFKYFLNFNLFSEIESLLCGTIILKESSFKHKDKNLCVLREVFSMKKKAFRTTRVAHVIGAVAVVIILVLSLSIPAFAARIDNINMRNGYGRMTPRDGDVTTLPDATLPDITTPGTMTPDVTTPNNQGTTTPDSNMGGGTEGENTVTNVPDDNIGGAVNDTDGDGKTDPVDKDDDGDGKPDSSDPDSNGNQVDDQEESAGMWGIVIAVIIVIAIIAVIISMIPKKKNGGV